ncbi:MAG TPA: hypothetical protein VM845_13785 [Burkholderiaceae bacterium]|jgi:hypothetical protein|nr:hypothetical protein [Burkholderiaceae bacterium]
MPPSRRPDPRAALFALTLAATLAYAALPLTARAAPDPTQPWRAAAARGDGPALADLTALPFLYEGRSLDRAQFIARAVPGLFTPAVRRCLQRAPAEAEDGALVLWCKPYGFYLRPVDGAWRLADFVADLP